MTGDFMNLGQLRKLTKDLSDETEIVVPVEINHRILYNRGRINIAVMTPTDNLFQSEPVENSESEFVILIGE